MDITSLAEMRAWIRLQLGYTVINVELTDEIIDSCIYVAIQYGQRYLGNDANIETYMPFLLSANVDSYNLSGMDIVDAVDFSYGTGTGPGGYYTNLFTPLNLLIPNNGFLFPGTGGNSGILTSFEVYNQWLAQINTMFSISYRLIYTEATQTLKVYPYPTQDSYGIMRVIKKVPLLSLLNNILIKDFTLARVKQVYGKILSKYRNLNLPGDGEVYSYGQDLMREGKEEEKELMIVFKESDSPLGFYTG